VFLLDEPLSNLDARLRGEVRASLRALQARLGATFVHVTHDQEEALALADHLVVLAEGRLQQAAPPGVVHAAPANRFVAGFVGSPTMVFVDGALAGGVFEGGGLACPVPRAQTAPSGAAVLGLRPSEIDLVAPADGRLGRARVAAVHELCDHADVELAVDGGARLVARLAGSVAHRERPAVGTLVGLSVPSARVHVFEPGPFGARIDGPR